MKPKRKVVLLSLGGVLGTLFLGAVSGVGKMLTTDLWPFLRPFFYTTWIWALELFTWLAQPIAFPLWSLILVPLIAIATLVSAIIYLIKNLKAAKGEIASLQDPPAPPVPPLNNDQELVLAAIAVYDCADKDCNVKGLPLHTGITLLQVNGAIDVLEQRKLISNYYANSGKFVSLSVAGRAYVLAPDYSPPTLPSRKTG